MKTPTIRLAAVAAASLLPALRAQFPQAEPFIAEDSPVIQYGEHIGGPNATGFASIYQTGQIRIYAFDYDAGSTIYFYGYTNGSLDLRLRILDPQNGFQEVVSNWVSGNSSSFPNGPIGAGMSLGVGPSQNLPTGSYLLEVSDQGGNETGQFGISLHVFQPLVGPVLQNGVMTTDTISPRTDEDIFGFYAEQGSLMNLFLRTHGCLDLRYTVYDDRGNELVATATVQGNSSSFPNGCITNQTNFNPFATATNPNAPCPATGLYWVKVNDHGLTETGTYDATIQCLFSPSGCPAAPFGFRLDIHQPTGPGSVAFDVTGGQPHAPFVTAFSFDPVNAGAPHTGWFGGLHISFPELASLVSVGYPFVGTLDGNGEMHWQAPLPFGPLPPLHAVTTRLSAGFGNIVDATPIETVSLQ